MSTFIPKHAYCMLHAQVMRLSVLGMTCAVCSGAVEKAIRSLPGVTKATVSLTQAVAEVHFNPGVTKPVGGRR